MSSDVEIHLRAYDEASNVIQSVASILDNTFQEVEGKTQELADTTSTATQTMANSFGQVEESAAGVGAATEKVTSSFSDSVVAMNSLALSGATLFMSFERVEKAEVAVDRANLMVQRSAETVDQAQKNLAESIDKYGANSEQAVDAADKLRIAQEALSVAQERAGISTNNLNQAMVYSALTVIPSLVAMVTAVGKAEETWTGIQRALNTAMDTNPILVVIGVIAGLVAIFVTVYETCKPFKDAIDSIASTFMSYLKPAVDAIVSALQWLWNNVLVPLAIFFAGAFGDAIKAVGAALSWLGDVLKPVIDAFKWFFGEIGNAIEGFKKQASDAQAQAELMFSAIQESAKTHTDPLVTYFKMQYDAMAKTVDDSLNQQLADINTKSTR